MGGTFSSESSQPLRVAQWATGNIGSRSLRHVIEHPSMELTGLFVYSPDKVGRDAGELAGGAAVGVAATDQLDEIIASNPDCVLYMPRAADVDVICQLLSAGVNVVSTCGMFHHPPTMDAGLRERVEAACAEGRSSIHSTGSSPGFITEAVPLTLLSIQRRLDRLTIHEFADMSPRNSPELLFQIMGFGTPPAELSPGRLDHGRHSFGPSLRTVASAIGLEFDDLQASGEVAVAPHDITIAAGTVPAGTVAAQRTTVSGIKDGRELLRFQATWYCSHELDPVWDLSPTGWRISVEGDAPLEVEMPFPFPIEEMADTPPATPRIAPSTPSPLCAPPHRES